MKHRGARARIKRSRYKGSKKVARALLEFLFDAHYGKEYFNVAKPVRLFDR